MSILYTTGPVQLYVATPPSISSSGYGAGLSELLGTYSSAYVHYLGTCDHAPQVEISPKYKEMISDLNGGALPFDVSWCGEDARITILLNRWNEWVYKTYAARPRPYLANGSGGTRGTYTASDVGRLILHEAKAVCLWCHFPYYTKYGTDNTLTTGFGAPKGYRFIATWPTLDAILGGSMSGKRLLQLQAVPVYNVADGTWKLFDENMTSPTIPAIPPVVPDGAIV